jgi:RHS repeat-associated protein
VRTYSSPDGAPVAERTTADGATGSTLYWVAANVDGTVDLEVDAGTGTVTRRYTDPYGNIRGAAPTWSDAHGFLNKPVSAATGLTTVGARLYDPVLGRFVSVDSVLAPGNPQQNNGYSYSANSPITMSDPSGGCYNVGSDSLSFHTNCVGSSGSAAGNGAAAAPGGGPSSKGASSSDFVPPLKGISSATTVTLNPPQSFVPPITGAFLARLFTAALAGALTSEGLVILSMKGDTGPGPVGANDESASSSASGGCDDFEEVCEDDWRKEVDEHYNSTGRTEPRNPTEAAAMNEVKAHPEYGEELRIELEDPRFAHLDGWIKMSRTVDDVEIHWNRNTWTGAVKDFKFKDR